MQIRRQKGGGLKLERMSPELREDVTGFIEQGALTVPRSVPRYN